MINKPKEEEQWTDIITSQSSLFRLGLKELVQYRDLIWIFVQREIATLYKQTILGPLWFFLQPLFTTLIFLLIFNRVAKLSTDGIPPILFYLSGIILWSYFADCITKTSATFTANANIFGKVYFPRYTLPLSNVISNLIRLAIQFLLLTVFYVYFISTGKVEFQINYCIFLLPVLIFLMALFGLGLGTLVSSLTTKYKDLSLLVAFGVQLLMYLTTVAYPLSVLPEKVAAIYKWNPLTIIIECFRYGLFGNGFFSWMHLLYAVVVGLLLFFLSLVLFNKVERSFMDTV